MENKSQQVTAIDRSRKMWVDGLRGLVMLLVIFGHQAKGFTEFSIYTSAIKMPMFFVITGYVFNENRTIIDDFFKNLFFKIIIPWISLTLPVFLVSSIFKGSSYLIERVTGVISGEHTWFMSCIVYTEIIWFFTNKAKAKWGGYSREAISILVFILGIICAEFKILEFGMINRAMIAQIYVLIGVVFKRYEIRLKQLPWLCILGIFVCYVILAFVGSIIWPGQTIDVHLNQYFNYPFCFLLICIGCFAMLIGASKYERCPKFIAFVGRNTLVFYLLHMQNVQAFRYTLKLVRVSIPETFILGALTKTIACVIMCSLEAIILNRYFPALVGKKKLLK